LRTSQQGGYSFLVCPAFLRGLAGGSIRFTVEGFGMPSYFSFLLKASSLWVVLISPSHGQAA
jgi:hypothetical protein